MSKILVLYYSTYGHIETMAGAVAEGARSVAGAEVTIKRVPELMSDDVLARIGGKASQKAPIAQPDELADYDGILFGTPTRFGNMAAQMRNFLDQTGKLWVGGNLIGKVASVFASTGTGGGNEATILTFIPTLLHQGMIYVGLPYSCKELADISELKGGSPYGAATIAGADGSRQPSAKELAMARFQGKHVAEIVANSLILLLGRHQIPPRRTQRLAWLVSPFLLLAMPPNSGEEPNDSIAIRCRLASKKIFVPSAGENHKLLGLLRGIVHAARFRHGREPVVLASGDQDGASHARDLVDRMKVGRGDSETRAQLPQKQRRD